MFSNDADSRTGKDATRNKMLISGTFLYYWFKKKQTALSGKTWSFVVSRNTDTTNSLFEIAAFQGISKPFI